MYKLIKNLYKTSNKFFTTNKVKIDDVYDFNKKLGAPDISKHIDFERFTEGNVKLETFPTKAYQNWKEEGVKKLVYGDTKNLRKDKIPISPKLGPFILHKPKLEDKSYSWCSCGMSKSQPFCDRSHKGTSFKPITFKLGEKVKEMSLCGCKMSKCAPFCDKKTCSKMRKTDKENIDNIVEKIL